MAGLTYIDRMKAFWRRQTEAPVLSHKAICLYMYIVHRANKAGWPNWVYIPLSGPRDDINLPNSTQDRVRKELIEHKYIKYKKGHKGQAPAYCLIDIVPAGGNYFGDYCGNISRHKDNGSHPARRGAPLGEKKALEELERVFAANNSMVIDALRDFVIRLYANGEKLKRVQISELKDALNNKDFDTQDDALSFIRQAQTVGDVLNDR